MINRATLKTTLCLSAAVLTIAVPVKADKAIVISDTGIAGITQVLDKYYSATPVKAKGEAEQYVESLIEAEEENVTKVESPYANLGISIANDYVNIRKQPNTDSEIVGKLYNGCATDILETKGDWVKIESGKVKGYINKEYLAIGEEAEKLEDKYASKYAIINTETLFVREGRGKDKEITTMVPYGESYYIIKEYNDWVKIEIDDEETGYVSKEYIKIDVKFKYAVSIEEEKAKLAAEEAAKKAEAERLAELAREQEESRQASAASSSNSSNNSSSSNSSSNSSSSNSSSSNNSSSNDEPAQSSSSSDSSKGQQVANYAVNFVGNPYVWGGTSLTNGADCSGFVQSIYSHFGIGIARTSGQQAATAGYEVSFDDRKPGDLIFYKNSSGAVGHVAMYIGNDKVVHASNARDGIKISTYNYRTPYKIRRIF